MIVMHSDAYHSDAYELADEPFNESPASIDGDVPLTDIRLEPIEFKCPVLTKPFYNAYESSSEADYDEDGEFKANTADIGSSFVSNGMEMPEVVFDYDYDVPSLDYDTEETYPSSRLTVVSTFSYFILLVCCLSRY